MAPTQLFEAMKILLALDSFKGTFSSEEIAQHIKCALPERWRSACTIQVLSDGGEGFTQVFKSVAGAKIHRTEVTAPLGEKVIAEFVQLGQRAIMETSAAAGLTLVKGALRPDLATTFGVGEMMRAAVEVGASELVLGLGGSATCDGGAGALQALGVRLLDAEMHPIALGNAGLAALATVDFSPLALPPSLSLLLASDVKNPLLGEDGAIKVFGKQKGVLPNQMPDFEARLAHFADLAEAVRHQRFRDVEGAGAAGGLGFAMLLLAASLKSVKIVSGFNFVSKFVHLDEQIAQSDIIITGEGKLDRTSFAGKVVGSVAHLCQKHRKPCIAIAGLSELSQQDAKDLGIEKVFAIFESMPPSLEKAKADTQSRLKTLLSDFAL